MSLEKILNDSGYKYCAVQDSGKSYIVLASPYTPYNILPKKYGSIDAYYIASNKMYHDIKQLKQTIIKEGYRTIEENVWLKAMGERGGLGSILQNTLLCNAEYGTRMVLSSIVVESEFEKVLEEKVQDFCKICKKCQIACPTQAITDILDVPKCLRCIQEYPEITHNQMGNRILGCDECQCCCPHNSKNRVDMPEELKGILSIENLNLAMNEPAKLAKSLVQWIGKNYARVSVIVRLINNYISQENNK